MKLRTADHGPATPTLFTPRTRQKWVVVARPLVAYIVSFTTPRASDGAVNVLESSIWIVYLTALFTTFQSKVIGCTGVSALVGDPGGRARRRRRRRRRAVVALTSIFVTNASPQKIRDVAGPDGIERADGRREVHREGLAGDVDVADGVNRHVDARVRLGAAVQCGVEQRRAGGFNSEMKASAPPLSERSARPQCRIVRGIRRCPRSRHCPRHRGRCRWRRHCRFRRTSPSRRAPNPQR